MDEDVHTIRTDQFYLYEKASKLINSTDYHVYMRCSFKRWKSNVYSEERKVELIQPACKEKLILRLEEASLLPLDFDKITDNLFNIAPFTSTDFRQDMMSVVAYHLKIYPRRQKMHGNHKQEDLILSHF